MSIAVGAVEHVQPTRELKPPFLVDAYLVLATLALVGFSLVMIYSTTAVASQEKLGDSLYYVKRQGIAALAGLVLMVVASRIPLSFIKRISPYLFFASVLALALTVIPGLADSAGGARRWVKLGPIRFQPGEFVKLGFIVFMAGFYARHEARLATFTYGIVKPLFLIGTVAALFLSQPDFGSSVVVTTVAIIMATVTGARLRYIALAGVFLAACAATLVIVSPYRMQRVMTFLSPTADPSGKGYQLTQSLIAVGTGRFDGVGLGASQQKLFFLPAAHTDFIFAVVAEELGFLGCLAIIAVFLTFLWRGSIWARRYADDTFTFALAVGLTLLIVLPAMLNIGVVTGLLPTKGMVLPLVGYGGSSLMVSLVTVGLLLSLARAHHRR